MKPFAVPDSISVPDSTSKPHPAPFALASRRKPRILGALGRFFDRILAKLPARKHLTAVMAMVVVMSVIIAGLMAVILLIIMALLTGPQAAG